jgi:3-deoxy-7-phosphoheptulonate synthase
MIYSFEHSDVRCRDFLSVLDDLKLDYETIERDKIVVRVFGHIDNSLKEKLTGESSERHDTATADRKLVIAGPCSVESEEQIDEVARFLSELGIRYLRGGAFKPRTQSSSFQGLGKTGLKLIASTAARYHMKVVTELMDRSQLDDVGQYADIIQVGSRNMFNYSLLTALGAVAKPILLKRGMAATIDEWVHAANYIRRGGNERVILCERGIRTYEPRTRFTLDVQAIPIARQLSGLPVIADASHAAGDRNQVPPLIKAALAAGADGIMVEVHPHPDAALSDGRQSMTPEGFHRIFEEITQMGLLNRSDSESGPTFYL